MLAIALYAIRSLVKFNGSRDRLLIPIAIVFLGFNLFLWLIYITAFGRFDALRVASFWRYNMQMGLLGATGAAYGLALVWQKYVVPYLAKRPSFAKSMSVLPIVLVLILPLALQHKIRFDMRPQKDHMRAVGQELATTLPDNASLAVIDLNSDGFTGTVIGYELTAGLGAGRGIKVPLRLSAYNRIKSTGQLIGLLNKTAVTHAWVHQPVPIIEATLKIRLAPYASHLLKRQNGKWLIVKSWPYDGYKDPHSLPD